MILCFELKTHIKNGCKTKLHFTNPHIFHLIHIPTKFIRNIFTIQIEILRFANDSVILTLTRNKIEMKKLKSFIILLSFTLTQTTSFGQEQFDNRVRCGAKKAMNDLYEFNTESKIEARKFDSQKNNLKDRNENCEKHYVIPVVFHVFDDEGGSKITKGQIKSALNKANIDFAGKNGDFNTVDNAFRDIRGTLNITFALAQLDPDGNATSGINYYNTKSGFGNGSGYNNEIASYAWDNYMYLNIYVMRDLYADNKTNNSGVAWYPDSWMSNNGLSRIVYNDLYLGNQGSSIASGEFQSTITHEIGHWLNLRHTFDSGCSGSGDGVADTPTTQGEAGCGPNAMSCGHITNGENYMDYNSSCYKMFTQGQIARMVSALENHPTRRPIWQIDNLIATGTYDKYQYQKPVADFSISSSTVNIGDIVYFNDLSCGDPVSWQWTIEGGQPNQSNEQNPSSVFENPGEYQVELTVTDANGENSSFSKEVFVGIDPLNCAQSYTFENTEVDSVPSGWTIISEDNTIGFWVEQDVYHEWDEVGPFTSYGHDSQRSIFSGENWGENGPIEITLVSPPIDLSSMDEPKLSYWTIRGWDAFWPDTKDFHQVEVLGGASPNGPWEEISSDIIIKDDFQKWVQFQDIYLSDYKDEPFYLAFRTNTHHYYWRIDDLCFEDDNVSNTEDIKLDSKVYFNGFEIVSTIKEFSIYNLVGELIGSTNRMTYDASDIRNGVYIIKYHNSTIPSKKLLIHK